MNPDPEAAYERRRQREARHERRQESRRQDLCYAASRMIPDHGLALTLGQIAAVARLSRGVAMGLYPSVADLAVDLVCRAWRALIETTAPKPDMTTEDFLARLIQALRADQAAHCVWQTIRSGLQSRNRKTMIEAEAFLTRCIGQALQEIRKDIPIDAAAEVADRVLCLARHAAYAASAPDPRAEAALIAKLLPRLYSASAEAPASSDAAAATVAVPPIAAPPAEVAPAEVSAPPAWTLPPPLPNGHDPPRRMA